MKLILFLIAVAALILVAGVVASRRTVARKPAATAPVLAITQEMRDRALAARAGELGIDASALPEGVWGIVMDTGYPEGLATVVALADGSASLYLGAGSGVVGGHAHAPVRAAASAAVAEAADQIGALAATTKLQPPSVGYTRIFVLTSRGVHASEPIPEATLGAEEHALSPVFHAMHAVITALRLASGDSR